MKKTFVILMAAGMMLLAGCDKADLAPQKAAQKMTLSALLPTQATKTSLDATDNTKVTWTTGDKIKVYSSYFDEFVGGTRYISSEFTLSAGAGTTNGTFTGEIEEGTPEYAVYPYDEEDTHMGADAIESYVHTTQRPSVGGFDPNAALMLGSVSKGGLIDFHYGVGFLKVTVPSDISNILMVTITADEDTSIAGEVSYSTDDFEVSSDESGVNFLYFMSNIGSLAAGDYYIAVIPFTSQGLTVEYTYFDDESRVTYLTKSSTAEISVAAGEVKTINVDMSGVTPTHPDL